MLSLKMKVVFALVNDDHSLMWNECLDLAQEVA